MKIGILGGTFNPVHNGHLHAAKAAVRKLDLDKVIFIPAYLPPHKKIAAGAAPSDRLKMLRLALRGMKRFSISEYEIRKRRTSYSVITAKFLKKKFGKDTKLFFLLGADSLTGLGKWKDIQKLLSFLQFAVIPRPGFKGETDIAGVVRIKVPAKDVSSTRIRQLIREGKPISRMVPGGVALYIRNKKLYR